MAEQPTFSRPIKNSNYSEFDQCFNDLLAMLDQHLSDPANPLNLDRFIHRFNDIRFPKDQHLTVWIFGHFNSGKSTLVNVLAQDDVSPTGIGRSTVTSLRIRSSDADTVCIYQSDGAMESLTKSELAKWMKSAPEGRLRRVREILVTTRQPILGFEGQLDLLDTAGLGGRMEVDLETTLKQLEKTVAAVLVYRYMEPLAEAYIVALGKLQSRNVPLFAICNKDPNYIYDEKIQPSSLEEHMSMAENELNNAGAECLRIDLYSAFANPSDLDNSSRRDLLTLKEELIELVNSGRIHSLRERVTNTIELLKDMEDYHGRRIEQLDKPVSKIKTEIRKIEDDSEALIILSKEVEEKIRSWQATLPKKLGVIEGIVSGATAGAVLVGGITMDPVSAAIGGGLGGLAGGVYGWVSSRLSRILKAPVRVSAKLMQFVESVHDSAIANHLEMPWTGEEVNDRNADNIIGDVRRVRKNILTARDNLIEEQKKRPEYQEYEKCKEVQMKERYSRSRFAKLDEDIGKSWR